MTSTEKQRIELPKLNGHNCFACGTENPIGLDLHFYREENSVCTDITLKKNYEGWENMAHGGIISTLIDETMSWTIMFFKRMFFVTRKMEIKYVKPVLIGIPLRVKGRVVDTTRPPIIKTVAEIRDDKGGLLVKGAAEFVALSRDQLSSVPEGLKQDMMALFDELPEP